MISGATSRGPIPARMLVSAQASRSGQGSGPKPVDAMGRKLASIAAGVILGVSLTGGAAWAVTTEQLLFLDGWRAIDRAYVDKGFNGGQSELCR